MLGLNSPDLDLRNRRPREERRGGCAFEVSGLSAEGGVGVRGLEEETMIGLESAGGRDGAAILSPLIYSRIESAVRVL